MEKAILATDLSRYFARLPEFKTVIEERISAVGGDTPGEDIAVKTMWQTETSSRELLMSMMMTASDLSASTKPWPVQKKVRSIRQLPLHFKQLSLINILLDFQSAELVSNEFFEQGDFERQKLNIKPDVRFEF